MTKTIFERERERETMLDGSGKIVKSVVSFNSSVTFVVVEVVVVATTRVTVLVS